MNNQADIILIEDNPFEAELAFHSFEKNHLINRVIHLDDGAEALDFIFSKGNYESRIGLPNPKLILLDLNLPKINGIEILKQIKANEKTRNIPVVIMTSSREEKDIIESYNCGVNSYLVKPVNFETFTKSITNLGFYWVILNQTPSILS